MNIFFSIGNSDDKLTQLEWHWFVDDIYEYIHGSDIVEKVHGVWFSSPDSMYQNACFCVDVCQGRDEEEFKEDLKRICRKYNQESIAYLSGVTEFIG